MNCEDTYIDGNGVVDEETGSGVADDGSVIGEGDEALVPDMGADMPAVGGDHVPVGGDHLPVEDMMADGIVDGDMVAGDMIGADGDCDCGCGSCACCGQDDIRINIEFIVNIDDDGEVAVSAA